MHPSDSCSERNNECTVILNDVMNPTPVILSDVTNPTPVILSEAKNLENKLEKF